MSVRNMLKVAMSLLLAMTIAATADTPAARVDLSLASAAGKLNDKIPYLLCIRICIGVCICDKRPPEYAECTCNRSGDAANSNKPAALLRGSAALQVKEKSENSGLIPYTECINTCGHCACTLKWPPESNMCLCMKDDSVPTKAVAAAVRLDQSLAVVKEKANELYEKLDLLAGPVPKKTRGDDKKMVLWTTSKLEEPIPYTECHRVCETACICPLIWPPEAAKCFCATRKSQAAGGKAVAK